MTSYDFPHSYDKSGGQKSQQGGERLKDYTSQTRVRRGKMDLPFFLITIVILTIGVVMVLSASFARSYYETGNATYIFRKQLIFAVSGVGLMLVTSLIPSKKFRKYSKILMYASILMLILVLLIGTSGGGAKRWIDLGFTTFQPSEIAKLAVILYFASMICRYKDKMKTFRYGVLPFALYIVVILALLIKEPHLSACIIISLICATMMFAGGTRLVWFIAGIVVLGGGGLLLTTKMAYASARIEAWKDPFSQIKGDGWQIVQSLYSVGSGGLLGLGLGQGRQKYLYLPEEHNDFIFSVVCEELGFIGALLILALFAMLIIRGYWLALHARDRYGSLVITGITTMLAIQVFFNVAVVINLIPCTGISLPFFSYGGTALWLQLVEMGIILSISRDIEDK